MCIHKSFWWPAPDASNGILSALLPRHHRRPHRAGAGAASGSGGPRGTGGCHVGPEALGKTWKPWENGGKTMEKPSENHRNHGKMVIQPTKTGWYTWI